MDLRMIIRGKWTLCTMLVVAVLSLLAFGAWSHRARGALTVRDRTSDIIKTCAPSPDHQVCYEREVPKLYPPLTVPEIFDVIREIRKRDASYQFCHLLAHELAEKVVLSDLDHWLDWISYNPPDGLCSNGFIHGVIVGRFRNDVLNDEQLAAAQPDFMRACEPRGDWQPSVLEQAICYHGMGHLYDFITNADLVRALSLCEETASSTVNDFRRMCREGVFMQIYQPIEPDDFYLLEQLPYQVTIDNYRAFCASFGNAAYVGACLREAWPLHAKEVLNGTGVVAFCSGQPPGETENCLKSMFSLVGKEHLENPHEAIAACMHISSPQRGACVGYAARTVLEESTKDIKEAVALCSAAPESEQDSCFEELASSAAYTFSPGSAEKSAFCALLPESYRAACDSR